ncbi:MAG: antibiotic biosynthesis monooxygenase [Pseudohongiella sp.]|nr:MAG: antibiotic biosynthesis monooxygenase [Pseudohongiella sp.]
MILEVAVLDVIPGLGPAFERNFRQAEKIISAMDGYVSHDLKHCMEKENRYILLVHWQALEDHTIGFRESPEYQRWRELLHHFYEPFPEVEHYEDLKQ